MDVGMTMLEGPPPLSTVVFPFLPLWIKFNQRKASVANAGYHAVITVNIHVNGMVSKLKGNYRSKVEGEASRTR